MPCFSLGKQIVKCQIGNGVTKRNSPVWFIGNKEVFHEPKDFYVTAGTLAVTIPSYIHTVYFDLAGSAGYGTNAGLGGRVTGQLKLEHGGGVLYLVSGYCTSGNCFSADYNASDIRTSADDLATRLVVAGGGGSASSRGNAGGAGGGLTGGNIAGAEGMAYGGTQTAGGTGAWTSGVSVGHIHQGRAGAFGYGASADNCGYCGQMGAGGAGWYGGGGGCGKWGKGVVFATGGAGGSSYTSGDCSNVVHTQGVQSGNGYVKIWY